MPTDIVSDSAIPDIAVRVSPEHFEVLRAIETVNFMNGRDVGEKTVERLRQLAESGLVDPAQTLNAHQPVTMW